MKNMIKLTSAIAVSVAVSVTGFADTLKTEGWLDFERPGSPQISPDGSQVLYVRRGFDKMKDRGKSAVWRIGADGQKHTYLLSGSSVKWSPSGDRIAYIARGKGGKAQLFVRWMDGSGATSQITSEIETPRGYAWAPDGKSIAFVGRTVESNKWHAKLPGKPAGAKWTSAPLVIDTVHYRQDRVGITNTGNDHIFVVPADGGTPKQLTSGKWNVSMRRIGGIATPGVLAWSGDSSKIYFDGQPREDGDLNVFESFVYSVDVASKEIAELTPKGGFFHSPSVSPDGKTIAYVGADEFASDTYRLNHLYKMNADGTGQMRLVGDLSDSPGNVTWAKNSKGIYFTYNHHGSRNVHYTDLKGKVKAVTEGDQMVSLGSVAKDGTLAYTLTSSHKPADVYVQDGKKAAKQLTDLNADIMDGVTLGEVREVWYDSTEDTKVHGWVILPPDYEEGKKYPLMLAIHGGPHGMYNVGFNYSFQDFAANGYVVLYTNPRGSTGYGAAFANSIQGIYPGPRDGMDLLKGVDYVVDNGFADPDRLFVQGCSGGGVLTTYLIAETDRFKAAAARCPVTNWIAMAGYSDVPSWVFRFFKKPYWEDPTDWLENSTLHMVGKVNTPTLLMTGDKDLRTPFEEAEMYFSALKMRGVPTRLVAMKGEYHGTGRIPSNWLRTQIFMRDWFKKYDPAAK